MDFLSILFSFLAHLKSDVLLYVIAFCYYSIWRSLKACGSLFMNFIYFSIITWKYIPMLLPLKLQKRGPGSCGLGTWRAKLQWPIHVSLPNTLPLPPPPSARFSFTVHRCFPETQREKEGTRENCSLHMVMASQSLSWWQGLSRRYGGACFHFTQRNPLQPHVVLPTQGVSLSPPLPHLVGGSCECLLSDCYAPGSAELLWSAINISLRRWGYICWSSSVAVLVIGTLWDPSVLQSTHPTTLLGRVLWWALEDYSSFWLCKLLGGGHLETLPQKDTIDCYSPNRSIPCSQPWFI